MAKTVLLTGATGFVGRHVEAALRRNGTSLKLVLRSKERERFDSRDLTRTPDMFAESAEWWQSVCQDVDIVLHLAWFVKPGAYLTDAANLDCLSGTLQLAKGAVAAGVRRFVGIGTCLEYEAGDGPLGIDTPLKPSTPYAAAKAAAYMALSQFVPAGGCEFGWCRLFYLHGEGEHPSRLVPSIRAALGRGERLDLTSGKQLRDYLDVADAAAMIAEFTLGRKLGAVNICSGHPVSVRRLAEQVADHYGRRDLLNFGGRDDDPSDPPMIVGVRNEDLR